MMKRLQEELAQFKRKMERIKQIELSEELIAQMKVGNLTGDLNNNWK